MFWDSVIAGLGLLGKWQVWVALFILWICSVVWFLFLVAIFGGFRKESYIYAYDSGEEILGCPTGCVTTILTLLVNTLLIAFIVLFLMPALLHVEGTLSSAYFVATYWGPALLGAFLGLLLVVILSIVPIVGSWVAHSPGAQLFIIACVVYVRVVESTRTPPLLYIVGYLILAGILISVFKWLAVAATIGTIANVSSALNERGRALKENAGSVVGSILALLFEPMGGLIAFLMFSQYAGFFVA